MLKLTNSKVEGTDKINISTVPQGQLALKTPGKRKKRRKKKAQQYKQNTIYANNMKLTSN